jgi:hypothetical protein
MDNHEPCQSPFADSFAWGPPTPERADLADFRGFSRLARLVLHERHRDSPDPGRQTMTAKFEALAFTLGFLATGFLTLVALPLA